MNTITKKILVSLVITIILYLALTAINGGNFVPASAENFMSLVILFIGIYVSTVGTYSSTSKSSSSKKSGKSASKASDDSEEGSVKWFNVKKGYGFITAADGADVELGLVAAGAFFEKAAQIRPRSCARAGRNAR